MLVPHSLLKSTGMVIAMFLVAGNIGMQTANAAAVNALSCSQPDVQTAVNAAKSGDTVLIPAGTCTWTARVSWTAPSNVILQGAGNQSILGGGDATVIIDDLNRTSLGDMGALDITTNASGTFRMTGITFTNTGTASNLTYQGSLRIGGSSHLFRADHFHLRNINAVAMQIDGWLYGVVDHALLDMSPNSTNNGIRINAPNWNGETLGVGDKSWADTTALGSNQFVFIEDSTFNNGASNDCTAGGRYVFRHNTFNTTAPAPTLQTHPTGGGARHRGCRAWEIYANTFTATSGQLISSAVFLSSGTGVIWGNTAPSSTASGGTGYQNFITGHAMRNNNSTYPQSAAPNGWGYCGTAQTGVTSAWDGNTNSSGYPCIDQLGRGKGNLLANDFPNAVNTATGTVAWPNQALEPIYEWLDIWNAVPNNPGLIWSNYDPQVQANRDYYLYSATFNGTSGVGSGLLSARPSTCTLNVGYWATDANTLFQCTATNTWAAYYTPYTYPHPLANSSGDSIPPTVSITLQ